MGTTNPATRAMDSLHAAMVVYSISPVQKAILTDHCCGMISGKYAITNPERVTHCIHLIENIAMQLIVQLCVNLHFFMKLRLAYLRKKFLLFIVII